MKTTRARRSRRTALRPIEERAYLLLSAGNHSPQSLARKLGVAGVTALRIVSRLRQAGHKIASVGLNGRRFYEVRDELTEEEWRNDPFVKAIGTVKVLPKRQQRWKEEDRIIYDD